MEKNKKVEKKSFKQMTLEQLAERQKPYPSDHPRGKAITSCIAEMIALDLQPPSIVDDVGFIRLMALVEPRYRIPSHRYLSNVTIPRMYSSVKCLILKMLQSTSHISVTTDIWSSSHSHHSFISLTAHFITSNMEKKDVMLIVLGNLMNPTQQKTLLLLSSLVFRIGNLRKS